jgi:large subunit ribosomal protein L22
MTVEARAQLNGLRTSPRKVRLLADLVRGKSVAEAKEQLKISKKHAASPVLKLIDSAVANAVHNHMATPETLRVQTIFVNEGPILKRWMPKAMGRATRINKRTSHITVVLSGESMKATIATEEMAPTSDTETVETIKKTTTKKSTTSKKKSDTKA